jgi:hypothetical protein
MRSLAIVDTSALVAAADTSEPEHRVCLDVLGRRDLDLVIPALVVAEAAYLVGTRLGPASEAAFIRGLSGFAIEAPDMDEWPLIADLVVHYGDFPIGTTDASVAVLADRFDTDVIVTLDRRQFGAIRSPQGRTFRLLPEPSTLHEEAASYQAAVEGR